MPRLSELQRVSVQGQAFQQSVDGNGEEALIEDERSKRSGSNVVEEKLRLLMQNSQSRFSFFRSRLSQLSR